MAKYLVKLRVMVLSQEIKEIEAISLEDAETIAEEQFEEEYETEGGLMVTEVQSVEEVDE